MQKKKKKKKIVTLSGFYLWERGVSVNLLTKKTLLRKCFLIN